MDTPNVSLAAAFVAGLISFVSPCVLPLVPIYLGYMTGTAVSSMTAAHRRATLAHAFFFVLGFAAVFTVLGAAASLLGHLIYPAMPYVVKLGGLILILFGLHMTGLVTIPLLNMERRLEVGGSAKKNYWSSFVVGFVFAAGWTPCVGPVLSAILLLAADAQTVGLGALLLAVYAFGLGLPFLIVAALVDVMVPLLRRAGRFLRLASVVGGALLMLMGLLLVTGLFEMLVFRLNSLTLGG